MASSSADRGEGATTIAELVEYENPEWNDGELRAAISFIVPEGLNPGDEMNIRLDDQEFMLFVPEGVCGGEDMLVDVDDIAYAHELDDPKEAFPIVCWACGRFQEEDETFQQDARCKQIKHFNVGFFCSDECAKKSRKRLDEFMIETGDGHGTMRKS
jgi:hypothetical protein